MRHCISPPPTTLHFDQAEVFGFAYGLVNQTAPNSKPHKLVVRRKEVAILLPAMQQMLN